MNTSTNNANQYENRILARLTEDEHERLRPRLEEVELKLGEVLTEPDEPIRYVYFPHRSALSVISIMEDGSEVEIGVIGNEGMSGLPIVLGTDSAPLQTIVQVANGASRIASNVFREEIVRGGQLYELMLRYAQAFFIQTAQTAACNRLHKLDERLARWLLMCQDRAMSCTLELTHEFLSIMLGVRRAGVSIAIGKLQADGILNGARGRVQIKDRQGLEAASCECYQVVRKEYQRLLGREALSYGP
jgi:CRP-like cAMP-binding protein